MKLSLPLLQTRHDYWKDRIGELGIWDPSLFRPIFIVIRKNHRRYHALFQRRIKTIGSKKEILDKIVFYNKVKDFDPKFVDSVLVHEMIHQFIIQNEIKDSSSHGKIFKSFMNQINQAFPHELVIRIKDENPDMPLAGPGDKVHVLLFLQLIDGNTLCCVINHLKIQDFQKMVVKNKKRWGVVKFVWAQSNDVFFNSFTRCTTRLHGIRKNPSELKKFFSDYSIQHLT